MGSRAWGPVTTPATAKAPGSSHIVPERFHSSEESSPGQQGKDGSKPKGKGEKKTEKKKKKKSEKKKSEKTKSEKKKKNKRNKNDEDDDEEEEGSECDHEPIGRGKDDDDDDDEENEGSGEFPDLAGYSDLLNLGGRKGKDTETKKRPAASSKTSSKKPSKRTTDGEEAWATWALQRMLL